jgi:hypothetical protein
LILVHQQLFTVKRIDCNLTDLPCPEAITNILSGTKGRSLLLLNRRKLIGSLEATGLVADTKLATIFPGRLVIITKPPSTTFYLQSVFSPVAPLLSFVDSTDSATLIAPSIELSAFVATVSGKTFALLSTGVLNQEDNETSFFLISSNIPDKEYLTKAFFWLKSLSEARVQPDALYLLPQMVVVGQTDKPDWLVNFESDPREVLLALQRLGEVVTIKKPSVIDFRYANPILK